MQIKWPVTGSVLLVGPPSSITLEYPFLQTQEGFSKSSIGIAFAQAKRLLCAGSPASDALLNAGTHPDFLYIHPEANSDWIKIDQIRELVNWAMGKPQIATKQIAIISPAHTLNLQAANALLKTLEEPLEHTLFILVTDKPSFIPITIRSRCFWIRIRSKSNFIKDPSLKQAMAKDLEMLEAKKNDPISIGTEWIKQDPKQILQYLLLFLNEKLIYLAENNHKLKNYRWWKFLDNVFEAKRALEGSNHPNVQLLIESLLIEYSSFNL